MGALWTEIDCPMDKVAEMKLYNLSGKQAMPITKKPIRMLMDLRIDTEHESSLDLSTIRRQKFQ